MQNRIHSLGNCCNRTGLVLFRSKFHDCSIELRCMFIHQAKCYFTEFFFAFPGINPVEMPKTDWENEIHFPSTTACFSSNAKGNGGRCVITHLSDYVLLHNDPGIFHHDVFTMNFAAACAGFWLWNNNRVPAHFNTSSTELLPAFLHPDIFQWSGGNNSNLFNRVCCNIISLSHM